VLGIVREHAHTGPVSSVPQVTYGGSKRLIKTRSRTAVARLSQLPYNDRRTIHGVRPPRNFERPQRMAGDERSS